MKGVDKMPFVVDASITMAWCFEDEKHDLADYVLDMMRTDSAIVPQLWTYEVANVLVVASRKKRITESQAIYFMQLLGNMPITIDDAGFEPTTLFTSGHSHELTAYDAAYLCLSERLGIPLATVDDNLKRAATVAGVELLTSKTAE